MRIAGDHRLAKRLFGWVTDTGHMAKTLLCHARGILSYYRTKLTSAKVEGINSKIRGLLAAANGITDSAFLKLRLYALHETMEIRRLVSW